MRKGQLTMRFRSFEVTSFDVQEVQPVMNFCGFKIWVFRNLRVDLEVMSHILATESGA